ncbi:50S ribosomal protein L7/L12, putative [Perkinsus marinus ATCC 50983]|uniref:50S ribosomal protein L7/L12, putative n=1 Tax=Perkinsus marinus (strain ATCC 50983 / TXsc) TaxID=423536 RepID=C5LDW4_PERM5|nr:50S ribosomal protein L7/L12, putative [Perkinsus marinus ATCC 50983]EER05128.1 50S ribosomal protein L7/L12, putative [Perkinsus marinus ATCC 50983]|eukprot:XP_002773312.1 50S ribosomal protein L7/L12, putative [Perkinsus marinus ATCC 50983]
MFELTEAEKRNHLLEIVDEIMTLDLRDARDLADVLEATLKSENFITTSAIPGRQPFPHPMHMFSGLDASTRPCMYRPYGMGGMLPQSGAVPHQQQPSVESAPSEERSKPEEGAPKPMVDDAGATSTPAAATQTGSLVALKLTGYEDGKKVTVVKEVRALLGLGLKESKDMVEDLPKILKKGLDKGEAQKVMEKFKSAGADVVIV